MWSYDCKVACTCGHMHAPAPSECQKEPLDSNAKGYHNQSLREKSMNEGQTMDSAI